MTEWIVDTINVSYEVSYSRSLVYAQVCFSVHCLYILYCVKFSPSCLYWIKLSVFVLIQCFCFEEQRLNPHEEVDMPVFFYIDPEFDEDPRMARVDTITLSYTFFEAKEGQTLPLPGYS